MDNVENTQRADPVDDDNPISPNGLGRALVISPHPDDESIGCGGTLRRHVLAGEAVGAVFLTSGEKGGHGRGEAETAAVREAEACAAARILGLSAVEFWRQSDGALRATPGLVRRLCDKIRAFRPGVIYVPHGREDHPDHQAAARLVRKAVRALAAEWNETAIPAETWSLQPTCHPERSEGSLPPAGTKEILRCAQDDGTGTASAVIAGRGLVLPEVWMYEVWTPLRRFDWVIDISATLDVKLAAVRAHASQCAVMQFDEACAGLARYRGEMHCWPKDGRPQGAYAEAFIEWRPAPLPDPDSNSDPAREVSGGVS